MRVLATDVRSDRVVVLEGSSFAGGVTSRLGMVLGGRVVLGVVGVIGR